jgi:hypothetical protein
MLNTKITGATLTKWARRQSNEERYLLRASFTCPITDHLIDSIANEQAQQVFRFARDEDFLSGAAFKVPDGLVTISATCPGDNGAARRMSIKDVRPVRIAVRAPGDSEPASVVLVMQWIATEADVVWCWHAEGVKATITIKPIKVVDKQTSIGMAPITPKDPEPIVDAPPPEAV